MELGEPKRRRVGEGAPGLCWSGDRGAWEHNPQGWTPSWVGGQGCQGWKQVSYWKLVLSFRWQKVGEG